MIQNMIRNTCRSCKGWLETVFVDLGTMAPANSFMNSIGEFNSEKAYPLVAKVCSDCLLVQLNCDVPPQEIFDEYVYFSSFSESWIAHAQAFTDWARNQFQLNSKSFVVEIASNDGYLLKNFLAHDIPCLGIDPSHTVASAAMEIGVPTEVDFFSAALAGKMVEKYGQADLMIANNVLAHVPDINNLLEGFKIMLKPKGVISFEFPHLLQLIEHVEFDTVYHEHFSYISIYALELAMHRHGLRIYSVEEIPTHGGSVRVLCCHAENAHITDTKQLADIRIKEALAGLDKLETYATFAEKPKAIRNAFQSFLSAAKVQNKTVVGYGAAAKGNTLLNYCGVSASEIMFVSDRNPHKQNKFLPTNHIPTCSVDEISELRPDYIVILPWNLKDEIMSQLEFVREWGGQFVVAIPTTKIL